MPPSKKSKTNARPTSAQADYLLKIRNETINALYEGRDGAVKLTKAELAFVFNISRQLIEHIVNKNT